MNQHQSRDRGVRLICGVSKEQMWPFSKYVTLCSKKAQPVFNVPRLEYWSFVYVSNESGPTAIVNDERIEPERLMTMRAL